MYRLIDLTIHKDMVKLFSFLKDNPSKAYKNSDFVKFLYFEPIGAYLIPFSLKNIMVNVTDKPALADHWELVRDLPLAVADSDLLAILSDLERHCLEGRRQGLGLDLSGFVFDCVVNGLDNQEDTAKLVKLMYLHGYDIEQVIALFSAIVRRKSLARPFLTMATHLYQEEVA